MEHHHFVRENSRHFDWAMASTSMDQWKFKKHSSLFTPEKDVTNLWFGILYDLCGLLWFPMVYYGFFISDS